VNVPCSYVSFPNLMERLGLCEDPQVIPAFIRKPAQWCSNRLYHRRRAEGERDKTPAPAVMPITNTNWAAEARET